MIHGDSELGGSGDDVWGNTMQNMRASQLPGEIQEIKVKSEKEGKKGNSTEKLAESK